MATQYTEKPKKLNSYRLLAGAHIGANFDEEPKKVKDEDTGETVYQYASKFYRQGETVKSEKDLVAFGGHEKFQLVGSDTTVSGTGDPTPGDPTPENVAYSAAVTPGGQVSTGFQSSTGTKEGTVSGPIDPKHPAHPANQAKGKQGMKGKSEKSDTPGARLVKSKTPDTEEGDSEGSGDTSDDNLDTMTLAELKQKCDDDEVDTSGCRSKADYLKALRSSK
jgi:hypothetical protein